MKTRMMTGLIPDPQGQAVEFMSDRDQLADRDRVAAVSCLANIQADRGLNRLRRP
jgi:hypothetical protein